MTHIFWDWNGTLLDDTKQALDTLNAMLVARGEKPIEMGFYRDTFAFPVRPFYQKICLKVNDGDWDALAMEYHRLYSQMEKRLNPDAMAALELAKQKGAKQSIISALRQDLLERDIERYALKPFFTNVCGSNNLDGASKLESAKRLKATLPPDEEVVVIGDAIHDFEVAKAIGARCVLHDQGSHAGWRLKEFAPTFPTILEAARHALGISQLSSCIQPSQSDIIRT